MILFFCSQEEEARRKRDEIKAKLANKNLVSLATDNFRCVCYNYYYIDADTKSATIFVSPTVHRFESKYLPAQIYAGNFKAFLEHHISFYSLGMVQRSSLETFSKRS